MDQQERLQLPPALQALLALQGALVEVALLVQQGLLGKQVPLVLPAQRDPLAQLAQLGRKVSKASVALLARLDPHQLLPAPPAQQGSPA